MIEISNDEAVALVVCVERDSNSTSVQPLRELINRIEKELGRNRIEKALRARNIPGGGRTEWWK